MGAERGSLGHLARRFVWSLGRAEPDPGDEQWLLALCSQREQQLYRVSSRQDRRHALECGRQAERLLTETAAGSAPETTDYGANPKAIIVAAALHDVGKTPARLSTFGRVLATIVAPFVAERSDFAAPASWWQRLGIYKAHPTIGAELLAGAGSDPLVIEWAHQHHRRPSERTIDPALAELLARAD